MVESGELWGNILIKVIHMVEQPQTLSDLAKEINVTLVKVGCANLRREFNSKLWACNRDRAFRLITEYRRALADLMVNDVSNRVISNASR